MVDKCTKKYKRLYKALIKKARSRDTEKLKAKWTCDKHHEKPDCWGGKRTVLLTGREHRLAHKYLMYMYKEKGGKKYAQMCAAYAILEKYACSEKERKEHRKARSEALTYSNNKSKYKTRGEIRPRTSESLKGDKHPSKKPGMKGKTQVAILWGDKAETICLFVMISINPKRRIFGVFLTRSSKSWGSRSHYHSSGPSAKDCYWFNKYDHHTIKEYRTRFKAQKARTKLEKELNPRYKGQFNYDHVLTYRAKCEYERLSSNEKRLIQAGGRNESNTNRLHGNGQPRSMARGQSSNLHKTNATNNESWINARDSGLA